MEALPFTTSLSAADKRVLADVLAYNAYISACEKGHQRFDALCNLGCRSKYVSAAVRGITTSLQLQTSASWPTCSPTMLASARVKKVTSGSMHCDIWLPRQEVSASVRGITTYLAVADKRFLADVITYIANISACDKGHQWFEALRLLGQMQRSRVMAAVVAHEKSMISYGTICFYGLGPLCSMISDITI